MKFNQDDTNKIGYATFADAADPSSGELA